jgi:hypothetical protein
LSIEPELHATSDALLANLDRLRELEMEKRRTPLESPRLVELSEEVERLAAIVLGASDVQSDLARLAGTLVETGELSGTTSIESMADTRDVHAVLADWRDTERRMSEVEGGTPEATKLRARIEVLRAEYRRAHEAAANRSNEPS